MMLSNFYNTAKVTIFVAQQQHPRRFLFPLFCPDWSSTVFVCVHNDDIGLLCVWKRERIIAP